MNTPTCTSRTTCGCDSRFQLPVGLLATDDRPGVSACLNCGALVWSNNNNGTGTAQGDSDSSDSFNTHESLTLETIAWLNRWPRLLATPDGDFACLPAAMRCTTLRELEVVRHTAWNAQRHLPCGRRLRRAGWPKTPPPDSLPSSLSHYRLLWEAAGFTPSTGLDTLLYWAIPSHTLVSPLALDALLQRRDLRQLLPGLAHSPVLHRRTVLCALAQEDTSLTSLLRPHLQSWLQLHDSAPDSPQKRVLAAEAEVCRASLRAWQLARTFSSNASPTDSVSAHEAQLSAA